MLTADACSPERPSPAEWLVVPVIRLWSFRFYALFPPFLPLWVKIHFVRMSLIPNKLHPPRKNP
jgi:hypothetical protein